MSAQHTPGPFKVAQSSHRNMAVVVGPEKEHIAYVTGETVSQQLRDARLFAAAPDLLREAQRAAEMLQEAHRCGVGHGAPDSLLAAIAKATGSTKS